jgi:hypothetical protein
MDFMRAAERLRGIRPVEGAGITENAGEAFGTTDPTGGPRKLELCVGRSKLAGAPRLPAPRRRRMGDDR